MFFTIVGHGGHLGHVTHSYQSVYLPSQKLSVFIYKIVLAVKIQNCPCCKIGQGHPRVIILSNYDGLESQIIHTKFHENRPASSGEKDF